MGQGEGAGALGCIGGGVGDMGEGQNPIWMGTGGFETWQEGITEVVVGGDEQDVAVRTGRAVGPRLAGGDMGGEGEGEEGGAATRSAVEEGEFTLRDATGPQPGERPDGWLGRGRGERGGGLLELVGCG